MKATNHKEQQAKPLKHWLNRQNMAASLGISPQAFDMWGVEAAAKIGRETFYTVEEVLENRLAKQRERFERESEGDESKLDKESGEREKILLIREQRIGQELKNAETRRELAPIDVIEWVLGKIGSQISAILESIPLKVKKMLPSLTATDIEHIKREIVKAQNAAARATIEIDDYYERNRGEDKEINTAGSLDSKPS